MSHNTTEEQEATELNTFVYDKQDIIAPANRRTGTRNMNGEISRTDPQNVNENQWDDGVVEEEEIFVPGKNGPFTPKMPLQPPPETQAPPRRANTDETDNEKGYAKDHDDETEPSFSFDPKKTEEVFEAVESSNDEPLPTCRLTRSSYLKKKYESLFFAIQYHDKEKMEKILNEAEDSTLVYLLTRRDENGRPCIMKAITRQSLSCIPPLLDRIQRLDFTLSKMNKMDALESRKKKNILHFAAQMVRDNEIINSLDNKDYSIIEQLADRKDCDGTTPLSVACRYQNHLMTQMLVKKGAKIDNVDNNGYSPIYWAAATAGSAETLKLFLDRGKRNSTNQQELFENHKLYKNKGTILQAILESQCPKTLQIFLEVADRKDDIISCLKKELNSERKFIHAICKTPLVSLVKLAIECETDQVLKRLDDDGATPLMIATEARQLGIVKVILSTNSGRNTLSWQKKNTKETPLMVACKLGFDEIVEFIMKNSDTAIKLDQTDKTVFHHAAKHDKILSIMIDTCSRMNYQDYLNLPDEDGYVPLHHAAASGSYKNVRLLLDEGVPYDSPKSHLGRTALHYAACSNIQCVETLLGHVMTQFTEDELRMKQFVDEVDCRLQTSLHIAASLGKWQTVEVLLKYGATLTCDYENETPLHLASVTGCTKTVNLLIQNNPTMVNRENLVGETPAMFAAVSGQTETLEILLNNNAKLWADSPDNYDNNGEKGKTCLDWAVINKKADTAKAILERDSWKETMKNSCFGPDGLLAKMVELMPKLAIDVLNKCETKKGCETTYDFFALQTISLTGKQDVQAMNALETMAKYSRNECLNHTVVQRFLDQKWTHRARKWYLFYLFVYTMFLLSFTVYISLVTEGYGSHDLSKIPFVLCCIFASLSVIKEFFQLHHRKLQYFCTVSTYLELIMYLCVFTFLPNDNKSNRQLQAGAIAIFLGWINFTWFLKRFPTYGIYIIMAKKVFVTFLKVFVPVSFFIIAFSMTFFVLLHKRDEGFENIVRSFLTSFVMMAGEVDYRDAFLQRNGKNFVLILLFLALFLALMSILLMNLLTGLAVGDIGVIMRRSLAEKRIQRAMLIVNMDKYLNKYPGLAAKYLEPIKTRQKRNSCAMSCLRTLMDKMFPTLHIEEDKEGKKSQECEITKMKEQLNSIQDTLEEIKQSLKRSQVPSAMKNRGFPKQKRNTII